MRNKNGIFLNILILYIEQTNNSKEKIFFLSMSSLLSANCYIQTKRIENSKISLRVIFNVLLQYISCSRRVYKGQKFGFFRKEPHSFSIDPKSSSRTVNRASLLVGLFGFSSVLLLHEKTFEDNEILRKLLNSLNRGIDRINLDILLKQKFEMFRKMHPCDKTVRVNLETNFLP